MNPIKKAWGLAIVGVGTVVLAGCVSSPDPIRVPVVAADTIYTGGNIITVNDAQASAEAPEGQQPR